VLLVATKATTLASALERIRGLPQLVVPLLNGLDHMDTLRRRFGAGRVVAGSIAVESIQAAPGRVVQTSPFARIELAPAPADSRAALTRLTAGLERAGVEVRHRASEAEVLWGKLVRLNALACTTSAYDAPLGEILRDPTRRAALEGCVREAAAVARAEGVPLAEPEAIATLAELWGAHTKLSSSLRRDLAAGRPSELDAIPGAILRAAARHQLRCATIERLIGQIERRWSPLRPGAPPRLPSASQA
jgi:2-dehydropantoate 2-reductase